MARIDINNNKRLPRYWFVGLISLIALLAIGKYIFRVHQERQTAKMEAFFRADKLAFYRSLEFLEERRGRKIGELIERMNGTNANAIVVHLFAESDISFPVSISNFSGLDMFVDPWGRPYRLTVVTSAPVPPFGRRIENRLLIEKGVPKEGGKGPG